MCFIIGSWILSNALNHKPDVSLNQTTQRQLLTQSELVDYLGLSKGEIQLLTELPVWWRFHLYSHFFILLVIIGASFAGGYGGGYGGFC